LIDAIPEAAAPEPAGGASHGSDIGGTGPGLPAVARLAEIPGLSPGTVHQILTETGLDMTRFPTAEHLVS
jgi:transposase